MPRGKRRDPKVMEAAVAEALRTGDWNKAAENHGIPRSTLNDERRRRAKAEAANPSPKRRRTGRSSDGSTSDDEPDDELAAIRRATDSASDFDTLDGIVLMLERRLDKLPPQSPRVASMTNALVAAVGKRARLRPPPPPDPKLEAEAKRLADGDIRLAIERYVEEWEHDAKLRGVCLWCGTPEHDDTHISLAEIAPLVQALSRWAATMDDGRATPEDRALWLAFEQAPAALKEAS